MVLLAAMLAVALAAALAGAAPHTGQSGQVTVLNPESYPLVGGTWSVELDVDGGGTLEVSAVDGTAFGKDIEFAGMYGRDKAHLEPSYTWSHDALRFDDLQEGRWTFEVNIITDGPHHMRFELGGNAAHASNTASFADVTSTTLDGKYRPGDTIDVRINFTEPVSFQQFEIVDGGSDGAGGTFAELEGAASITATKIGDSYYALVASTLDHGVQIINITNPASPAAVAAVTDGVDYPELLEAVSITTTQIGTSHYALVASRSDDGVQIINITDPVSPSAVAAVTDGATYPELLGANSITTTQIGTSHYALVASFSDHGVPIINITDPASPLPVANVTDGTTYPELLGAASITTTQIGTSHYALVASFSDHGVQIINITDPASPSAVAAVTDGATYPELRGAYSITNTQIGTSHYALVASFSDDGVQIIDITDPAHPLPVTALTDGVGGFEELHRAYSITTTQIGTSHYALVASFSDNGVQIIDITDPAHPLPVTALTDGVGGFEVLRGAQSITTTQIGASHYALVASSGDSSVQMIDITDPARPSNPLLPYVELDLKGDRRAIYTEQAHGNHALVFEYTVNDGDQTADLAYKGTGALKLGKNTIKDADDSTDLSTVTLPAPGAAHSLNHNKDISIVPYPAESFVTTWRTTAANEQITLPLVGNGINVDWGDGSTPATGVSGSVIHPYAVAGDHTVSISGGLKRIILNDGASALKLRSIDQWGNTQWTSMENAFSGAHNMVYKATDAPDLSGVRDMGSMFYSARAFTGDISSWNVSQVTNMNRMFKQAFDFNQPLNNWDVSSVTNMNSMFNEAFDFNQPLNNWNVSQVTDTGWMFNDATSFNRSLNDWDVSSVTSMERMFIRADNFNKPLNNWDVSSVTSMFLMFSNADSFNQPLNNWNVSSVTNMGRMFHNTGNFNQPLNNWNVSSVTSMIDMFHNTGNFNQPLNRWDVSAVTNMNSMFDFATSFDQNLGSWYVVANATSIARADVPGVVAEISAQNTRLDEHTPTYGIGAGGNFTLFEIAGGNHLNMTSVDTKSSYMVNVTASGPNVFENDNNWRVLNITVTGSANTAPTVNAGTDQTVREGDTVTLSGSATDDDAGDAVESYSWSAPPGSGITFADDSLASTTFTAPAVTTDTPFTITLTAFDGTDYGEAQIIVTVKETSGAFITTWRTTSADESITLPLSGTDITINWGDGNTTTGVLGSVSNPYAAAGNHTVSISGGLERINLDNGASALKLRSIDQWGDTQWTSMENAFNGARNMVYRATDVPDLSGVRDMGSMFGNARAFTGDISSWNVSQVTDMSNMFEWTTSFNQPLNDWNVSQVTNMNSMFEQASDFNQPLNSCNVSQVTDMGSMFYQAYDFNQPLNSWNVSQVTDMIWMFYQAYDFNQSLNDWNVSQVTDMLRMFAGATSFNQSLNDWNVSQVTRTSRMFDGAFSFNRPLNDWNVSKVTDMRQMFSGATSFDGNISGWNVLKVTDMSFMFSDATSFDGNISGWNVSKVTTMRQMFSDATSFDQPLNNWDVSSVTAMTDMFQGASSFRQNLGEWYVVLDDTAISDAAETLAIRAQNGVLGGQNPTYGLGQGDDSELFVLSGRTLGLNQTVDYSDKTAYSVSITSTGTFGTGNHRMVDITVDEMRDSTGDFITTWRTSTANQTVTIPVHPSSTYDYTVIWGDGFQNRGITGNAVHKYADAGDHQVRIYGTYPRIYLDSHVDAPKLASIDQWGSNQWTSMNSAFARATNMVYRATDVPDLSRVTDTSWMFNGARAFNGDISNWSVSTVTDMNRMFSGSAFNDNLSLWDVSSVTDMSAMFAYAASFNQSLDDWDVSSVTDMNSMFLGTTAFNGNLSSWKVSSVINTSGMFADSVFNQPLNDWDVSQVFSMREMFLDAIAFNQPLDDWDVSSVIHMTDMFDGATSFDQPLNNWDVSSVIHMTDMFDGASSFVQNLGEWYVNLDSTEIAGAPGKIGGILAQNQKLRDQNPVYGIGDGYDSEAFEISGNDLRMKISPDMHDYKVNVTSTGSFGSGNHRVYNVTVTGNLAPELETIANRTVAEEVQLGFTAVAHDPSFDSDNVDNDTLTFTLVVGSHPEGAAISPGGQFRWTPSETQDGQHTITVHVSDGRGGTDSKEFTVTVNEVNQAPVLSSIQDLDGDEGTAFTFDADADDDDVINGTPDSLTYSLEGNLTASVSFDGVTGQFSWTPGEEYDGTYDVTVRVTDGDVTDTENLTITVDEVNVSPTAQAGTYVPHGEGVTVTLDGSGSTDPDIISDVPDTLTYLWAQTSSGHTVTLSGADTASPTFESPTVFEGTTLTFELKVTDDAGLANTDTATVMITDDINELPDAETGLDRTVNEGGTLVTLDGTGSGDDNPSDSLSYLWSQTGGTPTVTLSDAGIGKVSFATPVVAANQLLMFTLNVTDSRGGWDTNEVVITIRDSASNAPIANIAGGSRDVNEHSPVTLDGSGSSDPNGDTLTYQWSQIGGTPDVGLSSDNDTASFTTPVVKQETPLTFRLIVNDGSEDGNMSVVITVNNNESDDPVAIAAGPPEADENSIITLNGSGSSDPNGDTLRYSWVPPQGITLSGADTAAPTFEVPQVVQPTDLAFVLTVRDTDGNEDEDTVTVRVRNSVNEPPNASASGPPSAGEGITITLDGSGSSDPNGDAIFYEWEYLTGTPSLALLKNDTASPEFQTPHVKEATDLEFRLTVTDIHGDSDTAVLAVTLQDTLSNLPVSVPGQDQTVGEGAPVTLDGSGSHDPNDDDLSYEWEQVAGPDVVLSNSSSKVTEFRAPGVQANTVLEFSLNVTDVDGSNADTVRVEVQNSQTNTPIALPQVSGTVHEGESVTLDGSDSYDPNNDDITHLWRQISGLPVVTLSGETTDMATFTAPRIPDPVTLLFELAVTDDITTGTARLSVVIPDDRNDPPVLQVIPAQSEDELQEVSFQASATDVDGNDLRFALAGQVPRGASMTRDGLFSWTTNQSQDGPYSLNVTVSDGDGGIDSGLAEVMVNDIEPRPVLARYASSSIVLTLSEIVTSGTTAGPNGFSVMPQNSVAVESISGSGTNSLMLLLNGTLQVGSTLSYDQSAGDVADETGKSLESFNDLSVSFPSKSRSSALSPAITIGSQGHPDTPGTTPSEPLQPVPTDNTSAFPLVIDRNGYALHSDTITVIPTTVTAGMPVTITATVYDPLQLLYFGIYLHLPGNMISHLDSDAYVAYDSGTIRVTDPGGLLSDLSMTISENPDNPSKKTVTLTVTFTESMGTTNMLMRTWNTDRQSTEVRIFDALAVISPNAADPEPDIVDPEPDTVDPEPTAVVPDAADPEPVAYSDTAEHEMLVIRMWSGFEPESLTDDQLLHALGLDYRGDDIPGWVMTELGPLVVKKGINTLKGLHSRSS